MASDNSHNDVVHYPFEVGEELWDVVKSENDDEFIQPVFFGNQFGRWTDIKGGHLFRIQPFHILAIAAAFRGMLLWETNCRLSGALITGDAAQTSLQIIVAEMAGYIFGLMEDDLMKERPHASPFTDRNEMISYATGQALSFFQQQYGDVDWWDPRQMLAHYTMVEVMDVVPDPPPMYTPTHRAVADDEGCDQGEATAS